MLPFYFGSSDRPLFGAYHPPEHGSVGTGGAVLCPPVGREHVHSYRALRRLAETLAGDGIHVLRFDYTGCGDSAGDAGEGSLERWTGDVCTAVEELRETAGARRISVVGLRMGAAVAALGCRRRDDVRSLVLWEPVVDGARYLRRLVAAHRRTIRDRHPPIRDGGGDGWTGDDAEAQALGFPLPDRLRRELEDLDLRRLELGEPAGAGIEAAGLVASRPDRPSRDLHRRLREAGLDVELRNVPTEGSWDRIDEAGQALFPPEALAAVAELAGRRG